MSHCEGTVWLNSGRSRMPRTGSYATGTWSGRRHLGWIRIFRAVFADGSRRISLHVVSLARRPPLVRRRYQLPLQIPWMSRRLYPARACMVGEPRCLRSIYHCRNWPTRTSFRLRFSRCGSQRRSIRLRCLHWPLSLCVLIWILYRPGTRR